MLITEVIEKFDIFRDVATKFDFLEVREPNADKQKCILSVCYKESIIIKSTE